ncbi:MAG: ubiquinol-cytochrome c reductase iron-sulfur subunit [Acidimicrobiia bacterium]
MTLGPALAIAVLVALATLVLFTTTRRRDTARLSAETLRKDRSDSPFLPEGETLHGRDYERAVTASAEPGREIVSAAETAPAPYVPVDPEVIGVTRRQFFNRSVVAMFGLGLSGFGGSMLAFLWPTVSSGFGAKITVSKDAVEGPIRDQRGPYYNPSGRFYINPYPKDSVSQAERVYSSSLLPGMQAGYVALYQKCPHLGCRVPWCQTSQWFECPCHGSQYNRVGEKKGGPAPRGLDAFPMEVKGDSITVDTGLIILGAAIGTNTTGQEAEGPHCVSAGSE